MSQKSDNTIHGGRNLMILGFAAFVIAAATTVASLQIYHVTGDIYLDRSRPGYIFDDEKHNEEDDQKETFSNEGEVNAGTIEEYTKELDKIIKRIDDSADDFAPEPLSDDSLGINEEAEED